MKYAPGEAPLRRLMQTLKATRFDPYGLSPADLATVVGYTVREADIARVVESAGASGPTARESQRPVSYIGTFEPRRSSAKANSGSVSGSAGRGRVQVVVGALAVVVLLAGSHFLSRA